MEMTVQLDWWLDAIASPLAPLAWFRRLQPAAAPARWLLALIKGLAVAGWGVGFVWLWFTAFWVLLLWGGFTAKK